MPQFRTPVLIQGYQTSDGAVHPDQTTATLAQVRIEFTEWMNTQFNGVVPPAILSQLSVTILTNWGVAMLPAPPAPEAVAEPAQQ